MIDVTRAVLAAVASLRGEPLVRAALAGRFPDGEVQVVGAGKAVASMARGARAALGERARLGVLIGKEVDEELGVRGAGHPFPDERSVRATEALLAEVAILDERATLLVLLSGGASALLGAPAFGLALEDLRRATTTLLAAGAPITEINTVRRHLGRALGGRLAAATRARVLVMALSDVIGDHPATVGSGPCSPDPTTFADALAVARQRGVDGAVLALLERGTRGELEETLKLGDPRLARVEYSLLATPLDLRSAVAAALRDGGWQVAVDPALVEEEVDPLAQRYGERARSLQPGEAIVAVGEPTVRLPLDAGRGGRAQQLALAVARHIAGGPCALLALGSDGSDGPTDAAGALVDGATWSPTAEEFLRRCDAYPFLDAARALLRTGPTGTNLLDVHVLHRPR